MASNKGWDREFYTLEGLAMKSGRSLNIAKGQFAVVDMESTQNQRGMEVLSSFTGLSKERKLEMRLGVTPIRGNRSMSNKAKATQPFKISEIKGLRVDSPKVKGIEVDHFRIGFDGLNQDTVFKLENGDNEMIEVTLSGKAIGLLGYTNATVTLQLYLEAPNTGDFTDQEIFERAVNVFNNMTLMGGVPVTNYVKASIVNSKAVANVGTDNSFFRLTLKDNGTEADKALVQAQVPGYDVKSEGNFGGATTYVILAPTATVLPEFSEAVVSTIPDCDECPAGYTLVEGLCTSETVVKTAWTKGETCVAKTETYTITLADPKCGTDRLEDLTAYYPELTITVKNTDETPNKGACLTSYTTTVNTNVVCADCSPEISGLFESESPMDFEQISWRKDKKEYSADALMGIDFKSTSQVMFADEQFRDEIPSMYSSVRLNVTGGLPFVNQSFKEGRQNRMPVTMLSRAQESENYGFNFQDWENRSNQHFLGRQRFVGNNYGNWALGQESNVKQGTQYVDYAMDVRTVRFSQSFGGEVVENFTYHVFAEVGKHKDVEDILNGLATAAGIATVKAYE